MYRANLIAVTPVGSVPDDLLPFVKFKADLAKRELKRDDVVALFVIESTDCYVPIFLDKGVTVDSVKEELKRLEAEMTSQIEKVLEARLSAIGSEKKK